MVVPVGVAIVVFPTPYEPTKNYLVGDISMLDELSCDNTEADEYRIDDVLVDFSCCSCCCSSLTVLYLIQKGSGKGGARMSISAAGAAKLARDSSVMPMGSAKPGRTVRLITRLNFASISSICTRL
jgi:hypothetical protein